MSTDEQMAVIGRLHLERTEANRELALLHNELKRYSEELQPLAAHLGRPDDLSRMAQAASLLDRLNLPDGLARLTQMVSDVRRLTRKLEEISQVLRNAGAM